MEWISVKDRLPEEDSKILVFEGYGIFLASYEFNEYQKKMFFYEYSTGKMFWDHVTHWMPLPELPKE